MTGYNRKTDYIALVRGRMAKCNRKTDYNVLARGQMTGCNRKTDYIALVRGQMGKAVFAQEPIHFQHKKIINTIYIMFQSTYKVL